MTGRMATAISMYTEPMSRLATSLLRRVAIRMGSVGLLLLSRMSAGVK